MRKHRPGLLLLAVALAAGLAALAGGSTREPQAVASGYVLPQAQSIYDSLTLHGQVIEQGRKAVYAPGPCFVRAVYVRVGQAVAAGQTLMEIETVARDSALGAALARELRQAADGLLSGSAEDIEDESDQLAEALAAGLMDQTAQAGQRYTVLSPIDGIVMETAAQGDTLSGILPVVQVSDMGKLALRVSVAEGSVALLAEGMDCTIQVGAVGTGASLPGRIETIMPYARQTGLITQSQETRTQLIVGILDGGHDLRPGYSATVQVITGCVEDSLTLPYAVIGQDEDNREYVMVLRDGRAIKTYIRTGRELESCVQVLAGLSRWDMVLTAPGLGHGQPVAAR